MLPVMCKDTFSIENQDIEAYFCLKLKLNILSVGNLVNIGLTVLFEKPFSKIKQKEDIIAKLQQIGKLCFCNNHDQDIINNINIMDTANLFYMINNIIKKNNEQENYH